MNAIIKCSRLILTACLLALGTAISKEEPAYDGYLFAYFEGSGDRMLQEQLRFGVSADARNWVALNDNQPIIESSRISKTGGIRDSHILRGEDGKTFYIVATDMFTHVYFQVHRRPRRALQRELEEVRQGASPSSAIISR